MSTDSKLSAERMELPMAGGLIALIAFLAYGLHLANLGFYLDDWYILWAGQAGGSRLIADLHAFDRPLMGHIFGFNYSLFGDSALAWGIFTFFLRLGSAYSIYWTVKLIRPGNRLEATTVAILALIYPGFLEQPNGMTYSNHIGTFALAALSIAFTVKGILAEQRPQQILFHLIAVVLTAVYVFFVEFMIGLEGIRLAMIWLTFRQKGHPSAGKALRSSALHYLPYMVPVLSMLVWRTVIFESGRASMNIERIGAEVLTPSIRNLGGLFLTTFTDLLETAVFPWFVNAFAFMTGASDRAAVLSIAAALAGMLGFSLYTRYFHKTENPSQESPTGLLWIGAVGVLTAVVPIVLVGREVHLDFAFNGFNRYTLPATYSVALLVTGAVSAVVRDRFRPYVLIGLIGLSLVVHYHNGLRYVTAWDQQRDLWHQAAWRIPDLADGTLLVVLMPEESRFQEGYEAWAPANLIYRPGSAEISITGQILNESTRGWFLRGYADQPVFRGEVAFERDYDNTLLLTFAAPVSCLHVLDGRLLIDDEASIAIHTAIVSSQEHIVPAGERAEPPPEIFGPDPGFSWCTYFQRIELARQLQDWPLAARLADEALAGDFKPLNRAEWFPVIAAYTFTGRSEEARDLAKIVRDDKELTDFLCGQLATLDTLDGQDPSQLHDILCTNP